MNDRPLSVLLAGDYAADPTLGSPKVFYKLQTEFEALGHSCDVMFGDEIGGPRSRQIRQLVEPAFAARAIGKRLARTRYDIVDAASAEGLWFGAARRLGRHRGAAYVCRSNGIEHLNYRRMLDDAAAGLASKPWSRRVWYPVSRLSQVAAAARVADRVLLLNETDRRFAIDRRWQTPDRIDVVPHGVSAAFLDDDPGEASPRGRGLLFCGSWDPVKGIPYLVAAYERMLANGAVWPLTILGPGIPAADVLAAFSDRARAGITVIPRAPESDVLRAYREHDALLWTSTYEGFGLVLIEAMSQRLPVVATPVGCAPDVVDDGVTGLRVPARAGEAVASAAAHLMDDPELRLRLGAAARARVMGMSWRATAERTVDVYRRALSAVAAG